jgi:hypothetical protein
MLSIFEPSSQRIKVYCVTIVSPLPTFEPFADIHNILCLLGHTNIVLLSLIHLVTTTRGTREIDKWNKH